MPILDEHIADLSVLRTQLKATLQATMFDILISTKVWNGMTKGEREICVRHIVSSSNTKNQVCAQLSEIGLTVNDHTVEWIEICNEDSESRKAYIFIKNYTDLISRNGALVVITTETDDEF